MAKLVMVVSACCKHQRMNREERVENARRMAAENAPGREVDAQKRANRLHQRLSDVGASQAQRHIAAAERADDAVYLHHIRRDQIGDLRRVEDAGRPLDVSREMGFDLPLEALQRQVYEYFR